MNTHMEYLILGAAILLVTGLLIFWAKAIRKPRKRRYEYPKPSATDSRKVSNHFSSSGRKQKRRRRSEPPTNPTLAETRGLPPIREDHRASAEHYQN